MATNLFSFNPFQGLTAGFVLQVNKFDQRRGTILPAHVLCGEGFIQVEKSWKPTLKDSRLFEATLRMVTPLQGKPFRVIDQGNSTSIYLQVTMATPAGISPKASANVVNAIGKTTVSEGVQVVMYDNLTPDSILEFVDDGAHVEIWAATGAVYRFRRHGLDIVQEHLTFEQMAGLRVVQLNEQIVTLDLNNSDHVRKYHGIVGGAVRLLQYAQDRKAREVLIDFLVQQNGPNLTMRLRDNIRMLLLGYKHPSSCMFVEGYDKPFLETKETCGRRKPTAKKVLRAQQDRERRAQMKGASSGGKQKKVAGKK